MKLVGSAQELSEICQRLRAQGRQIGFVATMGALHAGHLSLFEAARHRCDAVVASVFVNPTQFDDPEDLRRYPRDLEADAEVAAGSGVDFLFAPEVADLYPGERVVSVRIGGPLAELYEARSRPGHFAGVATVVAKLLWLVGPCTAFFGEKDFQQLLVVRRVAEELCRGVEVVGCPIVREADGLAMSSRNVLLSAEERRAATVLRRALSAADLAYRSAERDAAVLGERMMATLASEPLAEVDYAAVVDGSDLSGIGEAGPGSRAIVAVRIGSVRLIDNAALGDL